MTVQHNIIFCIVCVVEKEFASYKECTITVQKHPKGMAFLFAHTQTSGD